MTDNSNTAEHHGAGYGTYVLVWLGLVGLTAVTVAVAGFNLGALTLITALSVATVKTILVVNYFMHIKFDNKVFKVFIAVCIVTLFIIMLLMIFDVIYRPIR
jgi:cytochrome c oxidase subunit 4